jgi:polysaccharide biosynthesis transport protein
MSINSPSSPEPREQPFLSAPKGKEEFSLSRWIDVIKRRRQLLILVTGAVMLVSVLLYATTPKAYRATTVIQIERRIAAPVDVESAMGLESFWDAQTFYPTQFELLESRGLAERAVRDLRLYEDPEFNTNRAGFGQAQASVRPGADERVVAMLARRVQGGLSVDPIKDTRLVRISFTADEPDQAARIANGIADAYIDWGIEMRGRTVDRASSFIGAQIESLKQEIKNAEAQLQAYGRSTDIVALDPQSNVTMQRLEGLNRDYTAAMSDRIDKEARYRQLMSSRKEAIADSLAAGVVGELRGNVLRLEQEYAAKLSTYKPEWPAMQDLEAQIQKARVNLNEVIEETVQKARDAARTGYQTALRREQSLASELNRQKGEAMELNSAAVEYNNLQVEVSTRRQLLDELLRRQSETEVASRLQTSRESNVVIVDRALPPGGPFRPSLPRNLALGLLLGLGFGLGAVLLTDFLDRTLKSAEDVERLLGTPVLAVIPDVSNVAQTRSYGYSLISRRKKGEAEGGRTAVELITVNQPRLAVSEAYRALRTALLLSTANTLRTVLVTSAGTGEGKTVTSGNLAAVLAQLGRRVLLVDADLRKPRHHEIFKLSNRVGLVSYLTGQAELSEALIATPVENLHLAPSGPLPPNPAELLASDRMREFIELAKQRYDFVVLDSPPVLPVADATIMSELADGVVLTVGSNQVLREDAADCMQRLLLVDAKVLGAVLNRFTEPTGSGRRAAYQRYQAYLDESSGEQPAVRAG